MTSGLYAPCASRIIGEGQNQKVQGVSHFKTQILNNNAVIFQSLRMVDEDQNQKLLSESSKLSSSTCRELSEHLACLDSDAAIFHFHRVCLRVGDIVDIIATTPGLKTENLATELEILSQIISSLGLVANYNLENLIAGSPFFCDKALRVRQQSLHDALYNSNSKAIWFIRGGYGTAETLQIINPKIVPPSPKLLIGYSDINSLHILVNKFWNWQSIHFKVLYEMLEGVSNEELSLLKELLFPSNNSVIYNQVIALNSKAEQTENITAKITGGTIQVLQSGIGLNWQFDAEDKILFFEEIFDRGVRLYRTLKHFQKLNLIQKAKAIIFGDIICGLESDGSTNCDLAIKKFAQELEIPVFKIANIGHGKKNLPLILNKDCQILKKDEQYCLVLK
jgi:muramoyltetrapeptide carboxypeptidase